MIVVSDTTPLIGLAVIGHFDLLRQLFGKVYIASAVYEEAVTAGREKGGAREEVSSADWIETISVNDRLAVEVLLDELDLGEAETIVLARERNADWVLMDEKKGRRKLAEMGIQRVGTLGLLLNAKNGLAAADLHLIRDPGHRLPREEAVPAFRERDEIA